MASVWIYHAIGWERRLTDIIGCNHAQIITKEKLILNYF